MEWQPKERICNGLSLIFPLSVDCVMLQKKEKERKKEEEFKKTTSVPFGISRGGFRGAAVAGGVRPSDREEH